MFYIKINKLNSFTKTNTIENDKTDLIKIM